MADIQVSSIPDLIILYRLKELTKSKIMCSSTPKNSWPRKPLKESDTTRRLVLVSPHLRKFNHVLIGFKTPAEAIEGEYVDKKCPFTSDVSIRGRIFK